MMKITIIPKDPNELLTTTLRPTEAMNRKSPAAI
jgi:hypothetical protein